MRKLMFAALVLVGAAPRLEAGWGTVGYDRGILERQLYECPDRGLHHHLGCDQCLVRRYMPLSPFSRIFCGQPGVDWCPFRWRECEICNGSCAILWYSGERRWINVIGDLETVHDAIRDCMQWQTQSYCTTGDGHPIEGAYFAGEAFGSIPPHRENYESLLQDPAYRAELDRYSGGPPLSLEATWRHRVGLFAVLAQSAGTGPRHDHYARAANLCAWQLVIRFVPPGERELVLETMGLPRSLTALELDDLIAIQEVTCHERPFEDCWDAIEPATWGRIKNLYR